MYDRLRNYMDQLFDEAPQNKKTFDLKEEMLQNLIDKYNDLLAEGKSEELAYNLAISSVGDISELLADLQDTPRMRAEMEQAYERRRQRSAIFVSVAVALYILCVVPCILIPNGVIGPVLMFLMIALATGLLIYNNMTKARYPKLDDTMVQEFREWKASNGKQNQAFEALSGALWALTVAIYLLISFWTMAWHITWIIFLIAAAVNAMIKAIFDLKR
jgi:hypothetical protein